MPNIRNSRTTHPRKAIRRQRAAWRFSYVPEKMGDASYMARKMTEAKALGVFKEDRHA